MGTGSRWFIMIQGALLEQIRENRRKEEGKERKKDKNDSTCINSC